MLFRSFLSVIHRTLDNLPQWLNLGIGLCPNSYLFAFLDRVEPVMTIFIQNEDLLTVCHYESIRKASKLENNGGVAMLYYLYLFLLSRPHREERLMERAAVWTFVTSVFGKFGRKSDVDLLRRVQRSDRNLSSPVLKPLFRDATSRACAQIRNRTERATGRSWKRRRMVTGPQ